MQWDARGNERVVQGVSPTASTYQARVSLLVKHGGVAKTNTAVATDDKKVAVSFSIQGDWPSVDSNGRASSSIRIFMHGRRLGDED